MAKANSLKHSEANLDLAATAQLLRQRLQGEVTPGYLAGKTRIRDCTMDLLRCSALHAEELVDEMQSQGLVRYTDDPQKAGGGRGLWIIVDEPSSKATHR